VKSKKPKKNTEKKFVTVELGGQLGKMVEKRGKGSRVGAHTRGALGTDRGFLGQLRGEGRGGKEVFTGEGKGPTYGDIKDNLPHGDVRNCYFIGAKTFVKSAGRINQAGRKEGCGVAAHRTSA